MKETFWKGVVKIKKIVFDKRSITCFNEQLSLLHWGHTDFNGTACQIYDTFLRTLTDIYDANFLIREHILKDKTPNPLRSTKVLKNPRRKNKDYTSNFLRQRRLRISLSTKLTKVYLKN